MEKKIYQIEVLKATKQELVDNIIPDGLYSFDVFETKEEAEKWMSVYGYGSGVIDYKIVEYNESDIEDYNIVIVPTEDDICDECCPHCGCEVQLKCEFKMQRCPKCGKLIAPCNLCNHDLCDCSKCKLNKRCSSSNKCIDVQLKGKYKLVIYEFSYGLRGDLYEMIEPNKYVKTSSAKFYNSDCDATEYRVKEYFGF